MLADGGWIQGWQWQHHGQEDSNGCGGSIVVAGTAVAVTPVTGWRNQCPNGGMVFAERSYGGDHGDGSSLAAMAVTRWR